MARRVCVPGSRLEVRRAPPTTVLLLVPSGRGPIASRADHDFIEAKMELLVKVLVNADDDRVLGIHIVGKDAGEIMQGFGAAMVCGLTKQQLFDTVAIHPTIAEEIVCIPGIDRRPATRTYRNHELVDLDELVELTEPGRAGPE